MRRCLLQVSNLSKSFAERTVLDEVNFALHEGEAIAVVGPNGSGKSTLLRCVIGADSADHGQVLFDGKAFDETDPSMRGALAALLDDVDYFPDLSVAEHLHLYAWAHGQPAPDDLVDQILDEVDLRSAKDQLPITLSSGQRHRLGLASCLVRPRRVLVLDEPEQRLDQEGRRWLARRLNDEKASGVGVVIASHDAALVDAVADHLVEVGT
jgi:ABC-2 type transport system ATP-binding protein